MEFAPGKTRSKYGASSVQGLGAGPIWKGATRAAKCWRKVSKLLSPLPSP